MQAKQEIIQDLFATHAFRVSPADNPFWYTSGKFGPYYVNTHFLFGSEEEANKLLQTIDYSLEYPLGLPRVIGIACMRQYSSSEIYKRVIDYLLEVCETLDFDLISGGARRDFFFSYPVAELLGKDHLSILKDGSVYHSTANFKSIREISDSEFSGKKVLHIADLVTSASSYLRAWLPAIENCGAKIADSLVVVDRNQGGAENLADEKVKLHSLLRLNSDFFAQAKEMGEISEAQEKQLLRFAKDPTAYMLSFLEEHPDFLENSAKKDERSAQRVARFKTLGIIPE